MGTDRRGYRAIGRGGVSTSDVIRLALERLRLNAEALVEGLVEQAWKEVESLPGERSAAFQERRLARHQFSKNPIDLFEGSAQPADGVPTGRDSAGEQAP